IPLKPQVVLLAALTLLGSGCAELNHLPQLTAADLRFRPPQSSIIYDSSGRVITTLHGEQNRTLIRSLGRIPERVQNAVIAIEDQRFYEHTGVDVHAILRAIFKNAKSGSIQ